MALCLPHARRSRSLKNGNGLLSLVAALSVASVAFAGSDLHSVSATEVAKPPSSLTERETLTNDWFGAGPRMRENGVNLTASLTQFYGGLVSGDGSKEWEYGGKLDVFLRLDGGRLGLWNGLALSAHAELNYGHSRNSAGGTFLPNNIALFVPGANETIADLSLVLSQQLGDSVSLTFGKINTINAYDAGREFSGGRGIEQFMHVALVAPPSGVVPPMIFGGILSVRTKPANFTLMVYDPEDRTRESGFEDAFGDGVVFNGTIALPSNFFARSGRHFFNAVYSTMERTDFSDPYLLLPGTPPPATKGGTWYFGYAFEQTLWRDAHDPAKAWGLFGQAGISDEDINPIAWTVLGGIGGTSPIPGRERDKFGLGAFYLGYARGLKGGLNLLGLRARDETGLEIFYNLALTPWLRVTADAQVIRPPRSDRDTAILAGLRGQIIF